jgi:hypothetical protein
VRTGVKVTEPNGGEILASGSSYTIQADILGTNPVTKLSLYYTTDGGASYVFVESFSPGMAPPFGVGWPWTVPTPPGNRANCYVKVVAYNGSTVVASDRSDKPFMIERIKLLSPNGGEVYYSGNHYSIDWEINGAEYPVTTQKLYYSMDGRATWSLIRVLDGASRTYDWTVPTLPGNRANCFGKVVAYSGSKVVGTDTSDKPFTIGVVKLLGPNGGEVLESGSSYPIQWEIYGTKYPVATIKLYYTMDGGATWSLITTLDGSFRNYDWIPLAQTTKTKCKVRVAIADTKGVTAYDISDGYFTIRP